MIDTLKYWVCGILMLVLSQSTVAQSYNFVGNSAPLEGDCFILTPALEWQNGAIWYDEPIDISEPFNLQFTASFGGNDAGADGMVFVMQQVGNDVIGMAGGGMGFEGFSPSLGVEFDTFQNFDFGDPSYDHLAILKNGNASHYEPDNLAGPVEISPTGSNVEDNQDYIIDIRWDPTSTLFSVYVNCELRLETNISLQWTLFSGGQDIYWGFTGATGGMFNEQKVCLDPFILGLPASFDACLGQAVQLDAPAASFGSVQWEPAEFLDDPSVFNPIATVEENTDFTLTFEDLCGNQQVQETTVLVHDPFVDIGDDISTCDGEPVLLEASGDFDEIVWSDSSEENDLLVESSGTYWAEVAQGGCLASDTVVVNIQDPIAYEGETTVVLCSGEEFTFQMPAGDMEILWFDGSNEESRSFDEPGVYAFTLIQAACDQDYELEILPSNLEGFSLGPDISACGDDAIAISFEGDYEDVLWSDGSSVSELTVSQSGLYWASVSYNGCTIVDSVQVTMNTVPQYTGPNSANICEGETYAFEWDGGNQEIEWFDGSNESERFFDAPGVYTFELSAGDCASEYQIEIVVTEIPVFDLGEDVNLCAGSNHEFQTSVTNVNTTWSDGSNGNSLTVESGGTYWALLEDNGCTYSDTVIVIDIELPTLSASGVESLCPDETGLLTAESNAPLIWSTGESDNQIVVTEPGLYTVYATNSFDCTTHVQWRVLGLSLPRISPISDYLKCADESLEVIVESSSDVDLVWTHGYRGAIARIDEPGTYGVTLSNSCGEASRSFIVEDELCFDSFFLPNSFTPNGDGLNDLFKPEISRFERFEMAIYNRTGRVVFKSDNPNEGWNGNYQGDGYYCEAGVYVVRYMVDFGNNQVLEEFGSVVLIR